MFHTSAPLTPAPTTATTWSAGTSMTLPTVSATAAPSSNGPSNVNSAATSERGTGRCGPGGDERRDRVRRVVHAVGEVEGRGDGDRREQSTGHLEEATSPAGGGMVLLRSTMRRPLYLPFFGTSVG